MAMEHRITVYETMFGVRQGVLNLLAVGLYHLFEQQQLFFLRRGLLSRAEKDVPALLKVDEFEKRLAECGVECRSFSCDGKLRELRTAANAIKHAKGKAGDELAKLRPIFLGARICYSKATTRNRLPRRCGPNSGPNTCSTHRLPEMASTCRSATCPSGVTRR